MSARLALANRAPLGQALVFIGAMLPRAQRAASISGSGQLGVAPSAAAATLRVWSDLFDIVAATQQLPPTTAKATDEATTAPSLKQALTSDGRRREGGVRGWCAKCLVYKVSMV